MSLTFDQISLLVTTWGVLLMAGLCGATAGGTLVWNTITKRHERAQRAQDRTYSQLAKEGFFIRQVVNHTHDGLVVLDLKGRVIWGNRAYCDMLGRQLDDMVGKNPLSFAVPDRDKPPQAEIDAFSYDDGTASALHLRLNARSDGTEFWNQMSMRIVPTPDGNKHAIMVCRDVSKQVADAEKLEKISQKLEHEASHDSMTGLINRAAFLKMTQAHLRQAEANGGVIAMLRVDLDKFKVINDTYGHPAGDAVLIHVARALQMRMRQNDLIARVGGDEFVVVCPDVRTLDDLSAIAEQLGAQIAEPLAWNGATLTCTASFGGALSRPGMLSPDVLMLESDVALYEAKNQGRAQAAMFTPALQKRHEITARRLTDLAQALDQDGLNFHFQPTWRMDSGAVSGFESLLRWDHPTDGMLGPDDILPLAHELGRTAELDLASMRAGIALKLAIREAGLQDVRIGLNASAEGLRHPDYVNDLITAAQTHHLDMDKFAIEILETVVLDTDDDDNMAINAVSYLHDLGVQTFLDDFGVGFAGLAHLSRLDLNGIKIDKSLTVHAVSDPASSHIIRSLVGLCDDLGLRLIGEGVETHESACKLQELGVEIIQGYWFARPMRFNAVVPWLRNHKPIPLRPYTPSDIRSTLAATRGSLRKRA